MSEKGPDQADSEPESGDTTAKTTQEVLPYDEIDCLLLAIRDMEDLIAVRIMLFAGLRVSEACDLLMKDVDLEKAAVFVRQGKWSKDRWAPCDVHTVSSAKCFANLRRWDTDHRLIE